MKNIIVCLKIVLIPIAFILTQLIGAIISMCLFEGEHYKQNGTLVALSMLISAFLMFLFIYVFGEKNIAAFNTDAKKKN